MYTLASIIMGLAEILHLIRGLAGWKLIIKDWNMPAWASIVVGIVILYVAWSISPLV